jgi:all-trans-nonaprenyl-diphosphate synthase
VLLQVIKLISRVIADFANGEISQAGSLFDTEVTLEQYLEKSFYKTASLVAASCRSSAVFSKMDEDHKDAMYAYGKHLGLAFQVGVGAAAGGMGGSFYACRQVGGCGWMRTTRTR